MLAHSKPAISLASSFLAAVLIFGRITSLAGNQLTLDTVVYDPPAGQPACGGTLQVDATQAIQAEESITLRVGNYVGLTGDMQGNTLMATTIFYARVLCQ